MMAVVYELVKVAFELLASHLGVQGIAIGTLAAIVVGLWYLREVADVFIVLARYARVLSLVGVVVLLLLVGGSVLGVVESGDVRTVVGLFANKIRVL